MKSAQLHIISRVILFICALALLVVLMVPMWRIELDAPQYPEGLMLLIHANKLAGNVDIINGLNHYIGMKTLHDKDFIEFAILPGIIIFFSVACLISAIINKRKIVYILFSLFVFFGIIAMIDFWRWEYQYGHDLNPDAAIRIPGMAYQPPLIGFKQLLNFGAYSVPDIGGWLFILVGALLLGIVVFERKQFLKLFKGSLSVKVILVMALMSTMQSCNNSPEPIRIGKDNCQFCKMTISDNRFGAEVITAKGKIYKFDDGQCLLSFIKSGQLTEKEMANVYFVDFTGQHSLIPVKESFLLKGELFQSPMNGNLAAFSVKDSMEKMSIQYKANSVFWEQLNK